MHSEGEQKKHEEQQSRSNHVTSNTLLDKLIDLQSWNEGYQLCQQFAAVIGIELSKIQAEFYTGCKSHDVWASAIAQVLLQRAAQVDPDTYLLVLRKLQQFVTSEFHSNAAICTSVAPMTQ